MISNAIDKVNIQKEKVKNLYEGNIQSYKFFIILAVLLLILFGFVLFELIQNIIFYL